MFARVPGQDIENFHLGEGQWVERVDLTAGQNVPVPAAAFEVRLQQPGQGLVDLVALLLNDQGQVSADVDFVFYNAPRHPSGAAKLTR